jgi:two-component system, cell cycle sensor histidine kinase and response regulator CckA
VNVLLVEDNPGDARLIHNLLCKTSRLEWRFDVVCAESLAAALECIAERSFDVVLLDLSLPDSEGLATFRAMQAAEPWLPIVVLSGFDREETTLAAVELGAQDYLVKGQIARETLGRSLLHAVQRKAVEEKVRRQEALLAQAQQVARMGSFEWDLERNDVEWSSQLCRLFGVDPETASATGLALIERVHPDDRPILADAARRQLIATGRLACRVRATREDGALRHMEIHAEMDQGLRKPLRIIGTCQDVTDRIALEEAARERQLFQTIFQVGVVAMTIRTVPDGRCVFANDQFFADTGYRREDVIGKTPDELAMWVSPQDSERIEQDLRTQGICRNVETWLRMSRGVRRVVLSAVVIEFAGQPHVVSLWRDITDQKEAEERLRESEERYRRLVEFSADAIAVHSEGKFLYINAAGLNLLGATASEDVIGRSLLDFVDREYRDTVAARLREIEQDGRRAELVERKLATLDGRLIDAEVTTIPFTYGARPAIHLVLRDVTERKRAADALEWSERKYRMLFEQSKDAIFIRAADGRITEVNPAGVQLLGYGSAEEIVGRLDVEFYAHPDERQARHERLFERGFVKDQPLELRRRDGAVVPVLFTEAAVHDEHGELHSVRMSAHDMTEVRRLEEEFRHAQKMEAVGRLAGGVAHDFNNLLTALHTSAYLGSKLLPAEHPVQESFREIEEAGRRAADLTRQLLVFARRQMVTPKVVDLGELILNLTKLLRRLIGEDIELVTRTVSGSARVRVDSGLMEQVLVNLSVNARDAMPHGGRLVIETSEAVVGNGKAADVSLPAGTYVVLSLHDDGCGMSEEVKAHLFEPFFTTKEVGKGTGLGLATCYGIVSQIGGQIVVDSQIGIGTTFHVYLPRVEDQPTSTAADRSLEVPRGSETILLVEDESSVRSLVARLLRETGYRVVEVASGEAALGAVERDGGADIAVLVTDIVMPGASGRQIASLVRRIRPALPVLLISGYTDTVVVEDENAGIAFLQKPFSPDGLARKIRSLLDHGGGLSAHA